MKTIFVLILMAIFVFCQSQTIPEIVAANKELEKGDIIKATNMWENILLQNPENANFNFKMGLCYFLSFDKQIESLKYFMKAATQTTEKYDFNDPKMEEASIDAYFYIGEVFMAANIPDSALYYYNFYKNIALFNTVEWAEMRLNSVVNALRMKANPLNVSTKSISSNINSKFAESHPIVSLNNKLMFFCSQRPKPNALQQDRNGDEDIYFTTKNENEEWEIPVVWPYNSDLDEHPACISDSGKLLILAIKTNGNFDLYASKLVNNSWTKPIPLGPAINSAYDESDASMTFDGKIYFSSNRTDKGKNYDIFSSQRNEDNKWSKAEKLPSIINNLDNQVSPYIHPEGHTLYYSSNGSPDNIGGFDIYSIQRKNNKSWWEPQIIRWPLNTTMNDRDFSITFDSKRYATQLTALNSFDIVEFVGSSRFVDELSVSKGDAGYNNGIIIREANGSTNGEKEKAIVMINNLEKLDLSTATEVFSGIENEKAGDILEGMEVEKAIDLISGLNDEKNDSIVETLQKRANENKNSKAGVLLDKYKKRDKNLPKVYSVNSEEVDFGSLELANESSGVSLETSEDIDNVNLEGIEVEKSIDLSGSNKNGDSIVDNLYKKASLKNNSKKGKQQNKQKNGQSKVYAVNLDEVDYGSLEMADNPTDNEMSGEIVESGLESLEVEKAIDFSGGANKTNNDSIFRNFQKNKKAKRSYTNPSETLDANVRTVSGDEVSKSDDRDITSVKLALTTMNSENIEKILENTEYELAVDLIASLNEHKSDSIIEILQKKVNKDKKSNAGKILTNYPKHIKNAQPILFKIINFDFNSSKLHLLSEYELKSLANFLKNNVNSKIEVIGHTDSIGSWDVNYKISTQRARIVYDFLIKNDVNPSHIIYFGKGTLSPVTSNKNDFERKLNRRVEIFLYQ